MSVEIPKKLQKRRFEFGKNWQSYLLTIDQDRIAIAKQSLVDMLQVESFVGNKFLDIGSGSGLFSLAANQLGAEVLSFDYDVYSVKCTDEIRLRYGLDKYKWVVEQGDVLNEEYLSKMLNSFDIVYAWGVLHHTGKMYDAISNACKLVAKNGLLFIAIYNDQGWKTQLWKRVKRAYCSSLPGKMLVLVVFMPYFSFRMLLRCLAMRRNLFKEYKKERGMSIKHDWLDWLGGYPFEAASVEQVFSFIKRKQFALINISTTNGLGNNQYVFRKHGRSE